MDTRPLAAKHNAKLTKRDVLRAFGGHSSGPLAGRTSRIPGWLGVAGFGLWLALAAPALVLGQQPSPAPVAPAAPPDAESPPVSVPDSGPHFAAKAGAEAPEGQPPPDGPALTLDGFIRQVTDGNEALKGAFTHSQGELKKAGEAGLLTTPSLFASNQVTEDEKPSYNSFQPEKTHSTYSSVGISHSSAIGLKSKLTYGQTQVNLLGVSPFFYGADNFAYKETTTTLELTQPLWRNGFGSEIRSQQEALEAGHLADHHNNRQAARRMLADAEMAYWRLTAARESVGMRRDNLTQAEKMVEWNTRRAKFNLADRSGELQAQAAFKQRQLEYQRALDDERAASAGFNSARGVEGDRVAERLAPLIPEEMEKLSPPAPPQARDDVLAARETLRMAQATASAGLEKSKPELDLFANYTNTVLKTETELTPGLGTTYTGPTKSYGVRLTVPFGPAVDSDILDGYRDDIAAADLNYRRKLFEAETDWRDLTQRFVEAMNRLKLAREIELSQKEKLEYERERLKRGRTTTSQVILFEQDNAVAQLTRLQAQLEALSVLATLKSFGETP